MKKIYLIILFNVAFISHVNSTEAPTQHDQVSTLNKTNLSKIIPAYRASYTLLHKSDPVGKAVRQLKYLNDSKIEYHYETDISWLIFSDKRIETSIVALKNNQLLPLNYDYQREGTGRDKSYKWQYDFLNNKATNLKNNKQITLNHTDGLLDKLSYHLQNRIDLITNPQQKRFVYSVIGTKGTIKNYEYHYDGEEELILPYGLVKTIRLKREITEKKRVTYAWFAPELNYLLVKLYQVKSGAEQFEAQLSELEIK
ncbi:DUF3108 domain-containing protein [Colwelliaceae bacterium MEBiC 14330]